MGRGTYAMFESLEGLKVVRLASRINAGVNQEVYEFLKEHDMLWKG